MDPMDIVQTDPDQIAVPFAELVAAASAWDDAGRETDESLRTTRRGDAGCCGPRVGPVLAERLDRWCTEVGVISSAVGAHADALRACAATSALADADASRRFR